MVNRRKVLCTCVFLCIMRGHAIDRVFMTAQSLVKRGKIYYIPKIDALYHKPMKLPTQIALLVTIVPMQIWWLMMVVILKYWYIAQQGQTWYKKKLERSKLDSVVSSKLWSFVLAVKFSNLPPTANHKFMELYTLFNANTFCIVVYYIPLPVMASHIVTTSITTSTLN